MRYAPELFDCETIDESKNIILGATDKVTTGQRWEDETKWLMDRVKFEHTGLVVDYGCGIGRMARELSNPVLGVDISPMMRRHAIDYVNKPNFSVASPEAFEEMVKAGLRVEGMLTFWVLEHVLDLEPVLFLLRSALFNPGGILWHMDLGNRAVPFHSGNYVLMSDGVSIVDMLVRLFSLESEEEAPNNVGVLRKFRHG